ncbi:hypothetical protein [Acinetobacter gyllenbergii]|uniref:hypothetical protein n=1 Tax=Acinetobacter gyllenbergii TaxID=134534 RepID=UPI003AF5D146
MTEQTTAPEQGQPTTEQPTDQTSLLGGQGSDKPNEEATTEALALRPDSVDGYEVNIEGFNYDEFKSFEENQAFMQRAHDAGLNNDQVNFLLGEYANLLPKIMQENAALDNEACVQTMTEAWGNDTQANFGHAQTAANNLITNGVLTAEEINSPEFGNNPLVLKMASYFGKQLGEDTPPQNTQPNGAVNIQELIASEAYMNSSHPDHKRVYAQVEKHYAKSNQ